MEDKRLEKRKEFLNPVKDGRENREKYMVELRKKRKQDMFRAKRKIKISEESKTERKNFTLDSEGMIIEKAGFRKEDEEKVAVLKCVCPLLFQQDVELVRNIYKMYFRVQKFSE